MTTKDLRVYCVDDHADTLRLYQLVIDEEPDMMCVGTSMSTTGLLEAIERARPSVVTLDLRMPGADPLLLLESLHALMPDLHVLIVSGQESDPDCDAAITRGAAGFFKKTQDLDLLLNSIRRVARGERVNQH
jgi:DNA-binding NarL/FixJ family response regulator